MLFYKNTNYFRQMGLVALISTSTAIVLIFIGTAHDQDECMKEVGPFTIENNKTP